VYVKVGISLELATGLKVVQNVVEYSAGRFNLVDSFTYPRPEGSRPKGNWLPAGDGITSAAQNTLEFSADHKIYNVYFKGKILVEIWDSAANEGAGGWGSSGYITSSDTGRPVMLILAKQKEYSLAPRLDIRFTAMENDTMITKIVPVEKAQRDTYWNGMCLAPSAFVEAGAGVGVELLNFELFAKLAVSMGMTFGPYNEEEQKYDPFSFDEFELTLGIGFRIVALFFNIEKEAIQYILNYEKGRSGADEAPWMHGYSSLGAFGQMYPLEDRDSTPVAVSLPKTNYRSQQIFGPAGEGDLDPLAYDSTGAPFQISGYHSSGDAFTLARGLTTGYSYQVVTVGNDNYLFYTVSRDDAEINSTVDSSMLVMSKIKVTGDGGTSYGLVDPVTEAPGDYIVVDNDGTGDLEFKAWADGSDIHVIWTSYATETKEPAEPDSNVPRPLGTDSSKTPMDIDNYTDTDLFPVPAPVEKPAETLTEPNEVARPACDEVTQEPDVLFYYTDENMTGHNPTNFNSLQEADDAYSAACEAYNAWNEYRQYLDELAAYEENVTAWGNHEKYLAEKAAYDAWKDYFGLLDNYVRTLMAVSAKNTVVKTASFDTYASVDFTPAVIVGGDGIESGDSIGHVFLPEGAGDGSVLFYASANHFADGGEAANGAYKDYLMSIYGNEDSVSYKNIGAFLLEYQAAQNAIYGESSTLNIVSGGTTTSVALTNDTATPRTIDNLEMAEIGGVYYLAYTTVEKSDTSYTADDGTVKPDILYTRRLFLRTVTVDGSGVAFGDPYLLRTLANYDQTNNQDGIYSGGAMTAAYEDPYFANLQFLSAKLGSLTGVEEDFSPLETGIQTFLLFEMNGNTYVIPEADLRTIAEGVGGRHFGRIIPFFTKEIYTSKDGAGNTVETESSTTGYTDVTVGADSAGNIAAVYTAMVSGSTNNAIYITKYYTYEEEIGDNTVTKCGWSTGQMLAMKDMQVYEDSITYGWDAETTEAAYLEGITGDPGTTKASQFRFGNLQFALGTGGKALVITEGTLTQLMNKTYTHPATGEPMTAVVPAGDSEVGFYAVAFGQGQQAIGNTNVTLSDGSLKAGSHLRTSISFDNVGNTRIRGSESQPITVELLHHSSGKADDVVAKWKVIQSITPGQKVSLVGLAELKKDTKPGDYFYFRVAEDQEYAGQDLGSLDTLPGENDVIDADTLMPQGSGAFSVVSTVIDNPEDPANYAIGRYIVENLPDLGFESMVVKTVGVTDTGNTVLETDFYVSNRGTADAEGVFAQFSYQTGVDKNGDPTYAALDLTGSNFRIFNQTAIPDISTLGGADLQNGILRLVSTEDPSDGDNIAAGYGRQVSGTFYAAPENYYLDPATGTKLVNIRVEVFSAGDQTALNLMDGLYTASGPSGHNEIYSLDNEDETKLGHQTYFSTAHRIAIPMGNTLLLPIAITTTRDEAPAITVSEHRNHDIEGNMPNSLGVLYYDPDIKCIVMVPSREGNGIVRVSDTMTGCSMDIAFTVTEATTGINIYEDNDMFKFYNKNGTEYDPEKADNDWSFVNAPEWGVNRDVPYLTNLSKGEEGAYFTFDTVASAIDIYFSGQVSVDSNYPGFGKKTGLTATGGNAVSDARKVMFGDNSDFFTHTVTITVDSQTPTMFDKYVETYAGSVTPKPADDAVSPQIYWSRSFPDVASMSSGTATITCYVIDDNGIASVTLNRATPTLTKSPDNRFWQFDWVVAENGAFTVEAMDRGGNTTAITINAGWFNDPVTPGAISTAPSLDAEFQVDGNLWDGSAIPKEKAITLTSNSAGGSTVKVDKFVYTYDPDDNTKAISAGFAQIAEDSPVAVTSNSIYRVTATLPDGTWSSRILYMTGVDASLPAVSLTPTMVTLGDSKVPALSYSISKEATSAALLQRAAINGDIIPVSGRRAVGTWLPPGGMLFNGTYTLAATDTAGNSNTAGCTISGIGVDGSNAVNVVGAYNQDRSNGSISIDEDKVAGGMFVSMPSQTDYYGSYEYSLQPADNAFAYEDTSDITAEELAAYNLAMSEYFGGLTWASLTAKVEETGLVLGEHVLYIRDAQDPANTGVIYSQVITIADQAITFETYTDNASSISAKDGSITVVAAGGKGGNDTYQFAVAPLKDTNLLPIDSDQLVWVTADDANLSLARATFEGLGTGRYQIAVRGMYGVTAAEMQELHTKRGLLQIASASCESAATQKNVLTKAKAAYDAAVQALADDSTGDPNGNLAGAKDRAEYDLLVIIRSILGKSGNDPVTVEGDYSDALSAADSAIAAAQTSRDTAEKDYNSCVERADSTVALAYSNEPALWDNACAEMVYLGYTADEGNSSGILSVAYDSASGRVIFTLKSRRARLNTADQRKIRGENASKDVILKADGLTIIIPAGTLQSNDNINGLIPDLDAATVASGCVVAYTGADGNEHIVPLCLVTDGDVIFIVPSVGMYRVKQNSKAFNDIDGHWAKKYIDFITARELFLGTGSGMFSPDIPMTRAMFVTVLGRLMGVSKSEYTGKAFDDVPTGTWYSAFVLWASQNGIVDGYGHRRFGPNDPVTREQMCTMLVRFLRKQEITLPENPAAEFSDVDDISSWTLEAVAYCQRAGLVDGMGENRINPLGLATRAQVAAIYMRLILSILSN
jgi:hypothetical protein